MGFVEPIVGVVRIVQRRQAKQHVRAFAEPATLFGRGWFRDQAGAGGPRGDEIADS